MALTILSQQQKVGRTVCWYKLIIQQLLYFENSVENYSLKNSRPDKMHLCTMALHTPYGREIHPLCTELQADRSVVVVSDRNLEASCTSCAWHRFASCGRFIKALFIQCDLKMLEHIQFRECIVSSDLFPLELTQQQSGLSLLLDVYQSRAPPSLGSCFTF